MSSTATLILKILQAALGLTDLLRNFGINYREVQDAQDAAREKGEELSQEILLNFVGQAQSEVDKL